MRCGSQGTLGTSLKYLRARRILWGRGARSSAWYSRSADTYSQNSVRSAQSAAKQTNKHTAQGRGRTRAGAVRDPEAEGTEYSGYPGSSGHVEGARLRRAFEGALCHVSPLRSPPDDSTNSLQREHACGQATGYSWVLAVVRAGAAQSKGRVLVSTRRAGEPRARREELRALAGFTGSRRARGSARSPRTACAP